MRENKVGVALGAGAAKGWAHIGVLNTLQKYGVKVDIVVGCSVGSLVGAAYAANCLPMMEKWVRSFTYWQVIRLMDISWGRGGGLFRGERVFNHIKKLIGINQIGDCGLKFGAVATNLSSGLEVWLTKGDIHQAIRASCSMPGLFPPVLLDDYWLADGAVVNPLPISLTRALGADIIIAVDLQQENYIHKHSTPFFNLSTHEDLDKSHYDAPIGWRKRWQKRFENIHTKQKVEMPTAIEVMNTSIQLLESRLKRNRMVNDPPDVLIQPYCPQIATLDFHRANESIAAGCLAVEKQIDNILTLIKSR